MEEPRAEDETAGQGDPCWGFFVLCVKLTLSPWFNCFSILVILIDCAAQGSFQPCKGEHLIQEVIELGVFVYFAMEMIIKMRAMGVYDYGRNKWHKFDFFILCVEFTVIILNICGVLVEWLLVISMLRMISRVEEMRKAVSMISKILPTLANIFLVYFFIIYVFAVIGIQLWAGDLHRRCYLEENITQLYNQSMSPYYTSLPGEKVHYICSSKERGMRHCHDIPPLREGGNSCLLSPSQWELLADDQANVSGCINWNAYYTVCRAGGPNPLLGSIHFDTIGYAWITVFQAVTLEGWTDIMFYVMDSDSFWSFIFFVFLTFFGCFILMNTCATTVAVHYTKCKLDDDIDGVLTLRELWTLLRLELTGLYSRWNPHFELSIGRPSTPPCWQRFQRKMEELANGALFNAVIWLAILLNIFSLAAEHHGQSQELTTALNNCNNIVIALFVFEMIVKLISFGCSYFKEWGNIFDFTIAVISLWELAFDDRRKLIRVFRALWFLKGLRSISVLQRQLLELRKIFKESIGLFLFMFYGVFIYSVLGMHLFGCRFKISNTNLHLNTVEAIDPRKNFDSLLWSLVTVFQVLTQEDWHYVLYNAMASVSAWAALYFIVLIILGKNVVLNILLGICMDGLMSNESEGLSQSPGSDPIIISRDVHLRTNQSSSDPVEIPSVQDEEANQDHVHLRTNQSSSDPVEIPSVQDEEANQDHVHLRTNQSSSDPVEIPSVQDEEANQDHLNISINQSSSDPEANSVQDEEANQDHGGVWWNWRMPRCFKDFEDWSLFLFSPQNRFRLFCKRLIFHRPYNSMILFFILINCVFIGCERPSIEPGSKERRILDLGGDVFFAIFFVDMLIRIIASGFIFGKQSYCKSLSNITEVVLAIISIADILDSKVIPCSLKVIYVFRSLRIVKQQASLKAIYMRISSSFPGIVKVTFISSILIFFYSIIGVQLFKGKFYHCVGLDVTAIVNKSDCLSANYEWLQKDYHFDNIFQAMLSLTVMLSMDGWVRLLYDGVDAVGIDQQPVTNYNDWMIVFFITYVLLSLILLNMFAGVMVESYSRCQRGRHQLDDLEMCYPELPRDHMYIPNTAVIRLKMYRIINSGRLEKFINLFIIFSVLLMGAEHYEQSESVEVFLQWVFYISTGLLVLEILLKAYAFGFRRYLSKRMNILDIIIVLLSVSSLVLKGMKQSQRIPFNPSIFRVLRLFRFVQIARLSIIKDLVSLITKTLCEIRSLILLTVLYIYIFAVIGVELFGSIVCSPDFPCKGLYSYSDFKNVPVALLTLYRVCTGDGWSSILIDAMKGCQLDNNGCPSNAYWLAPIFFIVFTVFINFMILNLVVAVIMQVLEDIRKENNYREGWPTVPSHLLRYVEKRNRSSSGSFDESDLDQGENSSLPYSKSWPNLRRKDRNPYRPLLRRRRSTL